MYRVYWRVHELLPGRITGKALTDWVSWQYACEVRVSERANGRPTTTEYTGLPKGVTL